MFDLYRIQYPLNILNITSAVRGVTKTGEAKKSVLFFNIHKYLYCKSITTIAIFKQLCPFILKSSTNKLKNCQLIRFVLCVTVNKFYIVRRVTKLEDSILTCIYQLH
jgi:hypothetical protein